MSLTQDSTDATGVRDDTPRGNSEVNRARARKAKAALAMAAKGVEWDDIALALGYPDGDTCQAATERALGDSLATPESQTYLRSLAHARLEELLGAVYPQALDSDHPDQLAHHDRARKTIEQDSKLLGYIAPEQYVVNNPSAAQIEAWVARVSAAGTVEIPEADIFDMVEGPDGVYTQKDPGDAAPAE